MLRHDSLMFQIYLQRGFLRQMPKSCSQCQRFRTICSQFCVDKSVCSACIHRNIHLGLPICCGRAPAAKSPSGPTPKQQPLPEAVEAASYNAALAAWPNRTKSNISATCKTLLLPTGVVDSAFLQSSSLVGFTCPRGCGATFTVVRDVEEHVLDSSCMPSSSTFCKFESIGQSCGRDYCSRVSRFVERDRLYCTCGLPFESLYPLARHTITTPDHRDLEPGRCASLSSHGTSMLSSCADRSSSVAVAPILYM
jgi:hypothetical protein